MMKNDFNELTACITHNMNELRLELGWMNNAYFMRRRSLIEWTELNGLEPIPINLEIINTTTRIIWITLIEPYLTQNVGNNFNAFNWKWLDWTNFSSMPSHCSQIFDWLDVVWWLDVIGCWLVRVFWFLIGELGVVLLNSKNESKI